MMHLDRRLPGLLLMLLVLLSACSGEVDEARKYYSMGKYEAALNVANRALKKDRGDPDMAALVWKIQIRMQYCSDVASVEMACSLIREKAVPFGVRIIPALREALQEEEGCIKLFAIYTLGNIDSPEVPEILSAAAAGDFGPLKDGTISGDMIRGAALITLGQRGDKDAYPLMVEAARSESGDLRAMATEALGYVGDENTVPLLEELLDDPYSVGGERKVAVAATRALKMITGKDYEIGG
jgi:hypothetical protein